MAAAARLHTAELAAVAHHAPDRLEGMHDGLFSDPHTVPIDRKAIQDRTEQIVAGYEQALRIERRRLAREAKELKARLTGGD